MKMRDEADHKAMLAAGAAWLRIKKHAKRNWSDWTMTIGPALMRARSEAMAIAYTNKPKGKGYSTAMSGLLTEYRLDDMDGTARNDMISIMEEIAAVENWRNKQKNPTGLNHPTTVWRAFKGSDDHKAVLMEQGKYKPKPEKAPREKPTLLEELKTLRDLVIDLKGQLAEAIEERDQARAGGNNNITRNLSDDDLPKLYARARALLGDLGLLPALDWQESESVVTTDLSDYAAETWDGGRYFISPAADERDGKFGVSFTYPESLDLEDVVFADPSRLRRQRRSPSNTTGASDGPHPAIVGR